MLSQCETDFNIDRHLISFLQDSPFYAELSRHIHKVPTLDIPTAAVTFVEKTDELTLFWNPYFFGGGEYTDKSGKSHKYNKLSDREIRGVLLHEYNHLVFGHLYGRRRSPPDLWNIATDLAINSLIVTAANNDSGRRNDELALPEFCLIPGVFPKDISGREFTSAEKKSMKLGQIIANLPTMQASEWYFEKVKEELQDEEQSSGAGQIGSMDDHSMWGDIPEEIREYVESKTKAVVEKAVKAADSQANGWGNIPADMIEAIRKSVITVINWRSVLKQFVGSVVRGGRSTSIKRINKRYPYIHPGLKRGYTAKLLVAIDMSGSVSNEMLVEFFGELGALTKKTTIDVLPFDCDANEKDIFTWRKGQSIEPKRVRCGGTDFNAPTRVANDPKNRGRFDGLLILTDGEAPAPTGSRIKRGWVLGKGCKLMFNTDEIQINMTDEKVVKGAWR